MIDLDDPMGVPSDYGTEEYLAYEPSVPQGQPEQKTQAERDAEVRVFATLLLCVAVAGFVVLAVRNWAHVKRRRRRWRLRERRLVIPHPYIRFHGRLVAAPRPHHRSHRHVGGLGLLS